jgi:hypothetical protein
MKPTFPLVALTWLDAHGSISPSEVHEIPHAPIKITTYGLLMRDDEAGVSVANEACHDGTYRGVTFVPRGMVVSVEPVIKRKAKKTAVVAEKEQAQ